MLKKIERAIALLLSLVLTLQPVIVYAGDVRAVNPGSGSRPHVSEAPNGTQTINISTPNSTGVSHDRYTSFDVDDLILNNSATITDTRLGGWIEGNPNLKPGIEAKSWIGEVIGGNQTQLNGILEVAGERMDVILANEFGITCNGCGFINTGRATLTTGTPEFNSNGALSGFDVRRGTVTIGSGGLNQNSRLLATDRSRVDVIARTAAIYGAMHADSLNVVSGANKVDYDWSYDRETGDITGITPQSGSEDTPELAVDVSALGGMYANAIQLVATENGVGVRLNGEMASATNISLSANGQLNLGKTIGAHTPLIKARKKVSIRNHGPLLLEGAIISETNDNVDVYTSDGNLSVAGEISGGALTLEGAGLVTISGVLNSQSSLHVASTSNSVTLSDEARASASTLTVSSAADISLGGNVTIQNSAALNAGAKLTTQSTSALSADTIKLDGEALQTDGHVTANDDLVLTAGTGGITNNGALKGQNFTVNSAADFANIGKIDADVTARLTLAGAFTSGSSSELFAKNAELTVGAADLEGVIKADERLSITAISGSLDNKAILTGSVVHLSSATDLRNEGTVSATKSAMISANNLVFTSADSEISADVITIDAGKVEADGNLITQTDEGGEAETVITITTRSGDLITRGAVTADKTTLTSAADLITDGTVTGYSTATLNAGGSLVMNTGSELHGDDLTLSGQSVTLNGIATAGTLLKADTTAGDLLIGGHLSGKDIELTSVADIVHSGVIDADGSAILTASTLLQTTAGSALYGNIITAKAASLETGGDMIADETATLTATAGIFINTGLIGGKDIVLTAASDLDHSGKITAAKSVSLDVTGDFTSGTGSEVSGDAITIKAARIEADGDIIAEVDDDAVTEATLELVTRSGDLITRSAVTADKTTLTSAADLITDGTVTGYSTATLNAGASLVMNTGSELHGDDLTLSGQSVTLNGIATAGTLLKADTTAGDLLIGGHLSGKDIELTSVADIVHSGVIDADGSAILTASTLLQTTAGSALYGNIITAKAASLETGGDMIADETATLTATAGIFINTGLIGGKDIVLTAASDLDHSGKITAAKSVSLDVTGDFTSGTGSEVSGDAITIKAARIEADGDIIAKVDDDAVTEATLELVTHSGDLITRSAVTADKTTLTSAADLITDGTVTGYSTATLNAGASLVMNTGSELHGDDLTLSGQSVTLNGIATAGTLLKADTTAGDLLIGGHLSGKDIELTSVADIVHSGVVDADGSAILTASALLQTTAGSALYGNIITAKAASLETGGDIRGDETATLTATAGAFTNSGLIGGMDTALEAATSFTNSGTLAGTATLSVTAQQALTTTAPSKVFGADVSVKAASISIDGLMIAEDFLTVEAISAGIVNQGVLIGETTSLVSAAGLESTGSITGRSRASLFMADTFIMGTDFAVYGNAIDVTASAIAANGVIAANQDLTLNAGLGGISNTGTLSAQNIFLNSQSFITNSGTISAGDQLTLEALGTVTNAAAMISGNDLTVYAQSIINNGGVIWANDSVTLAGDAALNRAALVQNTNGRIEAFQGDLTIRADEVHNIGTAPTLNTSQIIRWLEKGKSGPVNSADEFLKLIDPAYLDSAGNILPAYSQNYLALWSDLLSGSPFLSDAAKVILKSSVVKPSGTQLSDGLQRLWSNMYSKANAAGTPDPVLAMRELLDPAVLGPDGSLLPEFEEAYLDLWETLASGRAIVSNQVRAILGPEALVYVESTDPVTGVIIRTYTNELAPDISTLWTAMSAGAAESYDIVKILYQDRFNDDGQLAELVAGSNVDIEADVIKNIFGNISAGGDLVLTVNQVENKAVGATQVLLEVHKKPDCFTCHEGDVDYYDTFGGRIEAVGNVSISGSVVNLTVNTSEMSMQDMIDTMNAFIAQRKAEGDPEMRGVPEVRTKTLKFGDSRTPDYIAPVEGGGTDIRKVSAVDTGSDTEVETGPGTPDVDVPDVETVEKTTAETGEGTPDVTTTDVATFTRTEVETGTGTPPVTVTDVTSVPTQTVKTGTGTPIIIPVETDEFHTTIETSVPVAPVITPTASVDELLAEGLTTLAETNPDFTDYANFITSNYMMDVGRLQYRDDLINNTDEPSANNFGSSDYIADAGPLDYLNKPVSVPNPDGSGMHTVYPSVASFELDGRGALIVGEDVAVSGTSIGNNGTISARNDLSLIGGLITGSDGAIIAEGDVSISSLTSVLLEDTKIAGNEVKIFAGQQVVGSGITLSADSDVSISGNSGVTITGLEKNFTIERKRPVLSGLTGEGEQPTMVVTSTRDVKDQQTSSLNVGGTLSIITNGDLVVAGADVDVAGDVKLTAGKDLVLTSVEVGSKTKSRNSKVEVSTSIVTDINAGGNLTATAGGDAVLMGTQIDVGGDADISAADNLVLAAVQDLYSSYSKKKKSGFLSSKTSIKSETKVTNKGVSIASGGDLDLLAETGDLTTAGTSLASGEGDVNLTAAEGNIYAGAYTDVHSQYSKTSKSILGGLFGSTKIINSVDKISRGTEALAALDLSLLSGEDTTLVGAFLSAGNNVNINTGGDFDVKAAINSHRKEFFEHEMGLVLMTTITENSYVETAVLTQFLAGQALNFNVGGDASLALYETAGVDAKTAEELYPEELLAIAGLQILQEQLANEYFYDKQVALSPAFKVLVSIAVGAFVAPAIVGAVFPGIASAASGTFLSAVSTGLEAFTTSVIVESLDGAVSGDFDIGDILADAAFSGATAGLTSGINIDILGITSETNPELFNSLLGDLGNGNLSIANILDGALDSLISNGLSSAVYGTDFTSQFGASMLRTVVNLAMADVQFEIGELGLEEGSLPHMLLHGMTGCAAAEATGASCAAGAAAAVAQSIYAGGQDDTLTQEEQKRALARAKFIGALAGYAFSGGDPVNVSIGAVIAQSGFKNNYLSHNNLDEMSAALAALKEECGEDGNTCSDYEARLDTILTSYMVISDGNNKRLASCTTRECINEHLANAASLVEIEDKLRGVSSSFVRHALDFHRLSLAEVRYEDVAQASARVRLFEEAEFFKDEHCGGAWDSACQSQFQQVVEDFNNGVEIGGKAQLVIAGLLAGGFVARSAVVGALEACAGSWLCATGVLGTEVSAQALAEFATGGAAASIGFTIAVKGGSRVMQVGDDVVAIIDDFDRVFYRAADDLADGTPVFRNSDGNLLRLSNTGDLVAVNRLQDFSPSELTNQRLLDGVGDLDVFTGRNQSVFYSGRGAREAAEAHATENGLSTLEQTTGGRYLDDLRLFDGTVADVGGDQAAAIWGRISSNYASHASGNVTAIVNNPRSSSIFLTQELPTLLQNPNVIQVTVRSVSGSQVTIPRGTSINDALSMIEGI
ncbi:filamentous hemagglutinin N-terminal domain-containing protein [Pseudovibrio sp. Tun.PSC04-5.I4]|uniref:two-partner secretion domain-containing protein n=1 Tax=Pseudovibrio sp. Tun.PSC04-5.I4 TaxID=1798213 RepID=UPI000880C61A|nr:filamentous hemagglutinin N-terminal domain-containing protein [Pseudovibrio sp. Tun.PSC04-5.I4]SDR45004.1 Haemagluttinin repeat-containing protein [Pseudovibrio sp. Tun.PSC04-5.I4]